MSDIDDIKKTIARDTQGSADWLTEGEVDVLAERRRQIIVEKFDEVHDDVEHDDDTLAKAAACYALGRYGVFGGTYPSERFVQIWPWDRKWWKPKTVRQNLVRAAALLLAAIDRIDRKAAKEKQS